MPELAAVYLECGWLQWWSSDWPVQRWIRRHSSLMNTGRVWRLLTEWSLGIHFKLHQHKLADSIPERILAAIYLQYLNVVCVSPTVVLSPELWNQVWVPDVGMERGYSRVHTPIALCHPIQDPLTSSHWPWLSPGKYCRTCRVGIIELLRAVFFPLRLNCQRWWMLYWVWYVMYTSSNWPLICMDSKLEPLRYPLLNYHVFQRNVNTNSRRQSKLTGISL